MLKITSQHDNIVTLDVRGQVDADEMTDGLNRLFDATADMRNGGLLMIYNDVTIPSMGALRVELGRLGDLFALLRRVDKIALVANQDWIRTAAKVEGLFLPNTQLRTFAPDRHDDAIAWLTVDPDLTLPDGA